MKLPKYTDEGKEFFGLLAFKLMQVAPSEEQRDQLQSVFTFLLTRRKEKGHMIEGQASLPKKLDEVLDNESEEWIIDAIEVYQQVWLQTHNELPCNLLLGEFAPRFRDLSDAIRDLELYNFSPSGEAKG